MKKQRFNLSICFIFLIFCIIQTACGLSPQEQRERFIEQCKSYLGTPYKYGGTNKNGMDCSGFIFTAAKESLGLNLPRRSEDLFNSLEHIEKADLQPGDLLFFKASTRINHAAVYLGENTFIHAASDGPKTGVIISNLDESYWKQTFAGCAKLLPHLSEKELASFLNAEKKTAEENLNEEIIDTPVAVTQKSSSTKSLRKKEESENIENETESEPAETKNTQNTTSRTKSLREKTEKTENIEISQNAQIAIAENKSSTNRRTKSLREKVNSQNTETAENAENTQTAKTENENSSNSTSRTKSLREKTENSENIEISQNAQIAVTQNTNSTNRRTKSLREKLDSQNIENAENTQNTQIAKTENENTQNNEEIEQNAGVVVLKKAENKKSGTKVLRKTEETETGEEIEEFENSQNILPENFENENEFETEIAQNIIEENEMQSGENFETSEEETFTAVVFEKYSEKQNNEKSSAIINDTQKVLENTESENLENSKVASQTEILKTEENIEKSSPATQTEETSNIQLAEDLKAEENIKVLPGENEKQNIQLAGNETNIQLKKENAQIDENADFTKLALQNQNSQNFALPIAEISSTENKEKIEQNSALQAKSEQKEENNSSKNAKYEPQKTVVAQPELNVTISVEGFIY